MSTEGWLEIKANDGRVLGYVEIILHANPDVSVTEAERLEIDAMVDLMQGYAVERAYSDSIPAGFRRYPKVETKPLEIPPHRVTEKEVYLKLHGVEYHIPEGNPKYQEACQAVYSQRWNDIPGLLGEYSPPGPSR
jgi:hypothetical protein